MKEMNETKSVFKYTKSLKEQSFKSRVSDNIVSVVLVQETNLELVHFAGYLII